MSTAEQFEASAAAGYGPGAGFHDEHERVAPFHIPPETLLDETFTHNLVDIAQTSRSTEEARARLRETYGGTASPAAIRLYKTLGRYDTLPGAVGTFLEDERNYSRTAFLLIKGDPAVTTGRFLSQLDGSRRMGTYSDADAMLIIETLREKLSQFKRSEPIELAAAALLQYRIRHDLPPLQPIITAQQHDWKYKALEVNTTPEPAAAAQPVAPEAPVAPVTTITPEAAPPEEEAAQETIADVTPITRHAEAAPAETTIAPTPEPEQEPTPTGTREVLVVNFTTPPAMVARKREVPTYGQEKVDISEEEFVVFLNRMHTNMPRLIRMMLSDTGIGQLASNIAETCTDVQQEYVTQLFGKLRVELMEREERGPKADRPVASLAKEAISDFSAYLSKRRGMGADLATAAQEYAIIFDTIYQDTEAVYADPALRENLLATMEGDQENNALALGSGNGDSEQEYNSGHDTLQMLPEACRFLTRMPSDVFTDRESLKDAVLTYLDLGEGIVEPGEAELSWAAEKAKQIANVEPDIAGLQARTFDSRDRARTQPWWTRMGMRKAARHMIDTARDTSLETPDIAHGLAVNRLHQCIGEALVNCLMERGIDLDNVQLRRIWREAVREQRRLKRSGDFVPDRIAPAAQARVQAFLTQLDRDTAPELDGTEQFSQVLAIMPRIMKGE